MDNFHLMLERLAAYDERFWLVPAPAIEAVGIWPAVRHWWLLHGKPVDECVFELPEELFLEHFESLERWEHPGGGYALRCLSARG